MVYSPVTMCGAMLQVPFVWLYKPQGIRSVPCDLLLGMVVIRKPVVNGPPQVARILFDEHVAVSPTAWA
jgi:hypothetical protein